ncbi:MAG: membrane dipeptidase, partial [Pseudomonadota bacterium]|nr:membrane dipeptidase [Pseudomonadota bacterium]
MSDHSNGGVMRFLLIVCGFLSSFAAIAAEATDAAKQLAQDALIVDTHIDAPGELVSHWDDLGIPTPNKEFDYPRARQGGLDVAFMSVYTSPLEDAEGKAWQSAHMQIDAIEALVQRHPDKFALLRSPGDVERLRAGGKVLL